MGSLSLNVHMTEFLQNMLVAADEQHNRRQGVRVAARVVNSGFPFDHGRVLGQPLRELETETRRHIPLHGRGSVRGSALFQRKSLSKIHRIHGADLASSQRAHKVVVQRNEQ